MINFALITEGKTDQAVLENIIYGFFGEDNVEVNPLQPLADATGANQFKNQQKEDLDGRYGNWLNVFKYCASEKFKSALQFNDFLIIQIDTDVSEKEGYDVPKSYINPEGDRQTLLPNELIEKVVDRLTTKMTLAVYEKFKDRILFAICVDSIECWLLPLFYQDQKAAKIQGCLEALNRQLRIQNQKIITDSKNIDTYHKISRPYAKQKNLLGVGMKNPSLSIFIEALKTINIEDFDD